MGEAIYGYMIKGSLDIKQCWWKIRAWLYPLEVLDPATLLLTLKGSLPFHSCIETLDHCTKPQERLSEDPLTNPEEIWYIDGNLVQLCLGWKKKSQICSSIQFWGHRSYIFATRYLSPISWAHGPDSNFRTGKRKKSSHLHWLQECLSGTACIWCYLERKRPFDHTSVPNQMWWSNL